MLIVLKTTMVTIAIVFVGGGDEDGYDDDDGYEDDAGDDHVDDDCGVHYSCDVITLLLPNECLPWHRNILKLFLRHLMAALGWLLSGLLLGCCQNLSSGLLLLVPSLTFSYLTMRRC